MYRIPNLFIYILFFFFFNDTATTEIYTLSLHDALPILLRSVNVATPFTAVTVVWPASVPPARFTRSEEHTSELQSHVNLVCRLLLEKKKKKRKRKTKKKKKKKEERKKKKKKKRKK